MVEGATIRFIGDAPSIPQGSSAPTTIEYLIGYTSVPVRVLDTITVETAYQKIFDLKLNTSNYTPLSTVSCLVAINGVPKKPFIDFTVYEDQIIFTEALDLAWTVTVRAVELIAPEFGKGASAITKVEDGEIKDIIVKEGGTGYRLNFTPKTTILSPAGTKGTLGTAESLVNGIKDISLIDGGQGYTSENPPIVIFDPPADTSGVIAKATVVIDDATGQVSAIDVTSSGSGYDAIPSISFTNPSGAKISDATIDAEGSVESGSITVTEGGLNYKTAPTVWIESPTAVNSIQASATATLDAVGRVNGVTVIAPGKGYTTPPRCRIIDPVGAQILDVTVSGGKLVDIELLFGGRGYTDPPSVYIVDNRKDLSGNPVGGTGATAVATIFNGEITDINITSFGTG